MKICGEHLDGVKEQGRSCLKKNKVRKRYLASSVFKTTCFAYAGIGDGVVFHTYLKQGKFKASITSRIAEELEADSSSGTCSKGDEADVNDDNSLIIFLMKMQKAK